MNKTGYEYKYEIFKNGENSIFVLNCNIDVNTINSVLVTLLRYSKRGIPIKFDLDRLCERDLYILKEIGFSEYCNISREICNTDYVKGVFPITKINSSSQVAVTISDLYKKLNDHFGIRDERIQNFVADFSVTISELIQNIPIHSEGNGFLYVYSTKEQEGHFLNCGIADDGIGIATTLKDYKSEYRHFWNDSFAITLALQKGVSRFRKVDSGRGKGLFGLYNRIQMWDGSLFLRSGKGLFIYSNKDYEAVEFDEAIMGVQIYMKIPIKNVQ